MSERSSRRAFKKAMQFRFLVRTYIENNMGFADKL